MMIFFGLFFLVVYAALVYYIGRSVWGLMLVRGRRSVSWKFKLLYIITLTVVSTSFIVGRFFDNTILHIIGSFWMALFYLMVILLPVLHLTIWLLGFTKIPRIHIDRWARVIVFSIVIFVISFGVYNAYTPTVNQYDVTVEKEVEMESLNIVMASDMHFGVLSGKNHAKKMVEQINALQPDVVIFPGDIVDDDIDPFVDKNIAEVLAQINAPYGVYASLGNHDKHNGPIEKLIDVIEEGNVTVLYDDSILIDDHFYIIGRKDRTDRSREELSVLTANLDKSKPLILVDHQPYDLDVAQEQGIDLMLSGHTHYGQVFPGNLITGRIYENDWGYLQLEQLHSIVSSGYGFWGPPIRIGSRSEIVQIVVSFLTE